MLSSVLAGIDGVEEAWVYGSWAGRYDGQPGPVPADIDVLIIGTAPLRRLRAALRGVEPDVGVEVNPVVIGRDQWERADDGFVANVREGPLVRVPLLVTAR